MKPLILAEMLTMYLGGLATRYEPGAGAQQLLELVGGPRGMKQGIAALVLLAILLTLDEVGFGQVAAAFGGLVALGYLLAAGGVLGPRLAELAGGLRS